MIVGLHDADDTGFPNLALMKLSAWHKAQGDTVRWWTDTGRKESPETVTEYFMLSV